METIHEFGLEYTNCTVPNVSPQNKNEMCNGHDVLYSSLNQRFIRQFSKVLQFMSETWKKYCT